MMSRILVFTLTAIAVAACGGAVEQPIDGTVPAPASTLKSSTNDYVPFGVWDLVSLDRDGAIPTEVHDVLQLDLKQDGTVTARRCGKQYYEPGSVSVRCGDESSYDCFYGTVTREGDAWRVDLPDLPKGDIRDERIIETVQYGETIKIRYIMPKSSAGLFKRAAEDVRYSTSSSYTVGNCKAGG
jgi:hypothetical protein